MPRAFALGLFCFSFLGCTSLNYEEEDATRSTAGEATATEATERVFGIPESDPSLADEAPLAWHELTRLAREERQQRRYEEADDHLRQAALQLEALPPTNASRRAVLGQRARLALELARLERFEEADLLAEELFAEVEREPAVGGTALVELADETAKRRKQAADPEFSEEAELALLELAFVSAQAGTASRERLNIAFEVSQLAQHLGRFELARRAIDQAVLDAQITSPLDRDQAASLKIYKSRIALAQGDLRTAEATALAANRIFEEVDADASSRGVGEATLALVLAASGETERALAIARGAYARLDADEDVFDHARRLIAGNLARVELLAGDEDTARQHFREAIDIPLADSPLDERLLAALERDLAALDQQPPPPLSSSAE